MSKDPYHHKYKKALSSLKAEKMDWSFDDFLSQVDEASTKDFHPIEAKPTTSFRWLYLAASIIVILGLGILLTNSNDNTSIMDEEEMRQSIVAQREVVLNQQYQRMVVETSTQDTMKVKSNNEHTAVVQYKEEEADGYLPKKSRLQKVSREYYAKNDSATQRSTYKAGYVKINGTKVENVEEAVHLTEYGLQVFANSLRGNIHNVSMTNNEE